MAEQAPVTQAQRVRAPRVVEVLYFSGCPSHEILMPRLRKLLAELEVSAVLAEREVATEDAATAGHFLGSPTVRVDGVDVEPGAASREAAGLTCRLYRTADGLVGAPPNEWILASIAAKPNV